MSYLKKQLTRMTITVNDAYKQLVEKYPLDTLTIGNVRSFFLYSQCFSDELDEGERENFHDRIINDLPTNGLVANFQHEKDMYAVRSAGDRVSNMVKNLEGLEKNLSDNSHKH